MTIRFLPKAEKAFCKLPLHIQEKSKKAFSFLLSNTVHPSLHVKKKRGEDDVWEARIDYRYRFAFLKTGDEYVILTIGPHDEGLGKK